MIGSIITAISGAVNRPAEREHEKEMLGMQHEADKRFSDQLERQNVRLHESNNELMKHVAGKNQENDDLFIQLMGGKDKVGDTPMVSTAVSTNLPPSGGETPATTTPATTTPATTTPATTTPAPVPTDPMEAQSSRPADTSANGAGPETVGTPVTAPGTPVTAPGTPVSGPMGDVSLPEAVAQFIKDTMGVGDSDGKPAPAAPAETSTKADGATGSGTEGAKGAKSEGTEGGKGEVSDRDKTSALLDLLDSLDLPPAVAKLIDALKALVDADKANNAPKSEGGEPATKGGEPVSKGDAPVSKETGETGEAKGKTPEATGDVKETGKAEAPTLDPIKDTEASLDAIIDVEKKGENLKKDVDRQVEAGTITEAEGEKLKGDIDTEIGKVKTSFEEGSESFGKDIQKLDNELTSTSSNLKELGMLQSKADEVMNEVESRVDNGEVSQEAAIMVYADVEEGLDVAKKATLDLNTSIDVGKFTEGVKDETIFGEFSDYLDKTDDDLNKLAQLDKKFDKVDGATSEDGTPTFSDKQVRVELETLEWK